MSYWFEDPFFYQVMNRKSLPIEVFFSLWCVWHCVRLEASILQTFSFRINIIHLQMHWTQIHFWVSGCAVTLLVMGITRVGKLVGCAWVFEAAARILDISTQPFICVSSYSDLCSNWTQIWTVGYITNTISPDDDRQSYRLERKQHRW